MLNKLSLSDPAENQKLPVFVETLLKETHELADEEEFANHISVENIRYKRRKLNLEDADSDIGEDEEFNLEKVILSIDEHLMKSKDTSFVQKNCEEENQDKHLQEFYDCTNSRNKNNQDSQNSSRVKSNKKRKFNDISNSNADQKDKPQK